MCAGFEWDEFAFPYGHPQNILTQNNDSDDYLKHIFERPIVDTPGERFNYNCACTILLGWILKNTTGMHADKYAEQHLFNHLSIDNYFWVKRRDGFPCVHGGLFLTARDMAKIGSLVLNEGKWQGKQIVSKNWIHESTRKHIKANNQDMGYGYQWWNINYPLNGKTLYAILAIGADPQKIIIIPELRTIIVTTGSFTFIEASKSPLRMIKKYITPALL
jgi:CubicO group peptidase (beta-lactamase class C family)